MLTGCRDYRTPKELPSREMVVNEVRVQQIVVENMKGLPMTQKG